MSGVPLCQDTNTNVFDTPSCCEQLAIGKEARGISGGDVARGIDGSSQGGARRLGITRTGSQARGIDGTGAPTQARGITGSGARGIDANDARGIDSNGARNRIVGCQGTMIDMNINYQKGNMNYLVCCDAGYEGATDFGGIPMCAQDIQDSNVEPIKAGADTGTISPVNVCCTAAQGFCPADTEVTDVDTSAEGQMIEVCCNPGSSINIEFAELNTCDTPSSTTLVKGQGANSAVAKSSAVSTAIAMTAVGVLL